MRKIKAGDKVVDPSRILHQEGVVELGVNAFEKDDEEGMQDALVRFSIADQQWFTKDELEWLEEHQHFVVKT
jgi:hypothetical protein